MTRDEINQLKKILLEALNSEEGQEAIKRGTLSTLGSSEGQNAIVGALESEKVRKSLRTLL